MRFPIKTENIAEILLTDGKWYTIDGSMHIQGFGETGVPHLWIQNLETYKGFKASVRTYPTDTGNTGECVIREIFGTMSSIVAVKLREQRHADLKEK